MNSKERAELRAQANTLDTILIVGKGGISETLVQETEKLLDVRELVKGRVLESAMDKAEEPLLNREGHRGGSWVLMDFGCLVVHVFTEEARAFYDLERLWQDGRQVSLSGLIAAE